MNLTQSNSFVSSSSSSDSKLAENLMINKVLASQLEKNLMILEQDYNLLIFKVQSNMNKLTQNNVLLSDIYKDGVNQWCESVENGMKYLKKLISDCEKLEDTFQSIEILSKKIAHFRMICEEIEKLY